MVFLLHDINDIFLEVRQSLFLGSHLGWPSQQTSVFDVPAHGASRALCIMPQQSLASSACPAMCCIVLCMQSAKMSRYANVPAIYSDCIFVIFMLTWIASRCIYFPFFIIRSTLFESAVSRATTTHISLVAVCAPCPNCRRCPSWLCNKRICLRSRS